MDDLFKGENPLPRGYKRFPFLKFLIAIVISFPVLPFLIAATFIKDWFLGGETLTTAFGSIFRKAPAGLVQRSASKTALAVAAARYIGFREGWTNDSLARHFIPTEVVKAIDYAKVFDIGYPVSIIASGFLLARTVAGDRIILNRKPKQIVLLGAGLDTRAHRLNLPSTSKFYEIDIATTQAMKRKTADANPKEFKGNVTYVAVDFSKQSFVERIKEDAKDFDLSSPDTVILFEGVSMYLQWEALKGTMQMISSNFADGTIVGMDVIEDMFSTEEARKRQKQFPRAKRLVRSVERLGEPFQWGIPPGETVESVFSKLGFDILADLGPRDIERLFLTAPGDKRPMGRTPNFARYVVLQVNRRKQ